MPLRPILLFACATLLYAGPFLAGLISGGWGTLAAFALIFSLWSLSQRPHLWPDTFSACFEAEALVALMALVLAQTLMALSAYVLGRGFGVLLGLRHAASPALPLALSFMAVPLARLVQPIKDNPWGQRFDPRRHRQSPSRRPLPPEDQALAHLIQICALPDQADEALLQSWLMRLPAEVDAQLMRRCFEDALMQRQLSRAGQKALILHATDPDVAGLLSGSAYPQLAFTLAENDEALLTLFATRATRVLEDDPTLAIDLPEAEALLRAARTASPEAAEALRRLAGLRDRMPPDEGGPERGGPERGGSTQ